MLNSIENMLFKGQNRHSGVLALDRQQQTLFLTLAPWPDLQPVHLFAFQEVEGFEEERLEEDVEFPLDIIGVDAIPLENQRWKFWLQCSEVGYGWEAVWPIAMEKSHQQT
jgi:hypothetical protein